MNKNYIAPTIQVIAVATECPLALSGGTSGSASEDSGTGSAGSIGSGGDGSGSEIEAAKGQGSFDLWDD